MKVFCHHMSRSTNLVTVVWQEINMIKQRCCVHTCICPAHLRLGHSPQVSWQMSLCWISGSWCPSVCSAPSPADTPPPPPDTAPGQTTGPPDTHSWRSSRTRSGERKSTCFLCNNPPSPCCKSFHRSIVRYCHVKLRSRSGKSRVRVQSQSNLKRSLKISKDLKR